MALRGKKQERELAQLLGEEPAEYDGGDTQNSDKKLSKLKRAHALYVAVITYWPWKIIGYVTGISECKIEIKILQRVCILVRILLAVIGLVTQAITCLRRDRLGKDFIHTRTENDTNKLVECQESSQLFSAIIIPDVIFLLLLFWVSLKTWFLQDKKGLSELVTIIANSERKPDKCMQYFYPFIPPAYLIFSLAVSIINLYAFNVVDGDVVIHWSSGTNISGFWKIFLLVISFLGFIAFDLLYIQLIVSYSLQCQLNIYFLQAIKRKVKETEFNQQYNSQHEAIEHVEKARNFINELNTSSITVGVGIMITAVRAVNCIISFLDKDNTIFQAIALLLRLSHWLFLTLFPFFQAALVNLVILKLHATGLVMCRMPILFRNNEPFNDMLKTYASLITIKAKLFGFTVHSWFPYVIMILIALTLTVGSRFKWYENNF